MSDFDKEAEREKLREKLERDEEAREATQHMSELLLKGATMTNKHCDQCSDPIFRYEGQEFCPTCGQEAAAEAGADESGGAEQAPDAVGDTQSQTAGDAPADGATAPADADAPADDTTRTVDSRSEPTATPAGGRSVDTPTAGEPAAGGDLQAARGALVRKLARLAQQAEATDDVGRSRELLVAAKEAAEALAAVENARR